MGASMHCVLLLVLPGSAGHPNGDSTLESASSRPASQPFEPYAWRNDSQNLAVTRGLNKYLAATPFSDDVSGAAISDSPPVALEWSLGTDHPTHTQKDGHGCWIGTDFVVAGGLWETRGSDSPAPPAADTAWRYDTLSDSWSKLPNPQFVQTRGTGACTTDALILVGGRGTNKHGKPWLQPGSKSGSLTVARLAKNQTSQWVWESLTPMPESSYRWLGAAGVCGDWLVVAAGTNTSSFQFTDSGFLREGASGVPNNLPVTLPSFRLNLRSPAPSAQWEPIAEFPGGGLDAPNTAVVGGELYVLGGWRGSVGGMEAWSGACTSRPPARPFRL